MWDGRNRRKFPRAEYPCLIMLRRNTLPVKTILTHTENISVEGVRVIIGEQLAAATEVDLEIDLMDRLSTITSKGIIKWVKGALSGRQGKALQYNTGIQFVSLEDGYKQRIQSILDRHAQ